MVRCRDCLLILKRLWNIFFGGRRRCRKCQHFDEDYITSFSGHGLFRFGYCQLLAHDCKVVEPDVDRKCRDFKKRGESEGLTEL